MDAGLGHTACLSPPGQVILVGLFRCGWYFLGGLDCPSHSVYNISSKMSGSCRSFSELACWVGYNIERWCRVSYRIVGPAWAEARLGPLGRLRPAFGLSRL